MTLRKTVSTAVLLATVSVGAVAAQTADEIKQQLIQSFIDENVYSKIEVQERWNGYKLEGIRTDGGTVERTYDANGNLLKEEIEINGVTTERRFDAQGNLLSEEVDDDSEEDNSTEDGSDEEDSDDESTEDNSAEDNDGDGSDSDDSSDEA